MTYQILKELSHEKFMEFMKDSLHNLDMISKYEMSNVPIKTEDEFTERKERDTQLALKT